MPMTVAELHDELGKLIADGEGGALLLVEEVGEGYTGLVEDVDTVLVNPHTGHTYVTLLSEQEEG